MRSTVLLLFATAFLSCEEGKQLLQSFNRVEDAYSLGEYSAVPGKSASGFLAKRMKAKNEDLDQIMAALNVAQTEVGQANLVRLGLLSADEASEPQEVTGDVASVLNKNQGRKLSMDADTFLEDENSFFTKSSPSLVRQSLLSDAVNWTASDNEFIVSVASKIPVRNTGYDFGLGVAVDANGCATTASSAIVALRLRMG